MKTKKILLAVALAVTGVLACAVAAAAAVPHGGVDRVLAESGGEYDIKDVPH